MKLFYHDLFTFPLPDSHRFPIEKYQALRARIVSEGLVQEGNLFIPTAATDEQLSLVHTQEYIYKIKHGDLTDKEIRRIGFPWSPNLNERARRSVGSTIEACRAAIEDGIAVNLAGGTHHAFANHGEGYCVFNDVAVASKVIQRENRVDRIVIIDTDVHQGNGTAHILQDDPNVFTFSIHCEKNFPFRKQFSDLDIGLPIDTGDEVYLAELQRGLEESIRLAAPDLAIYLAGADPFEGDRLGKLKITKKGLAERDRLVFDACQAANLPIAVTMSGGYSSVQDTTSIHFETIRIALEFEKLGINSSKIG